MEGFCRKIKLTIPELFHGISDSDVLKVVALSHTGNSTIYPLTRRNHKLLSILHFTKSWRQWGFYKAFG